MKQVSLSSIPYYLILGLDIVSYAACFSSNSQYHCGWNGNVGYGMYRAKGCRPTMRLFSWQDDLKGWLFGETQNTENNRIYEPSEGQQEDTETMIGSVVRLAGRKFNSTSSKPSSREYTTRKDSRNSIQVTEGGVDEDYNHYRTIALNSTKNRAISILTLDVIKSIRSFYKTYSIQDGDLGENILIDGLYFNFFEVGKRYQFVSSDDSMAEAQSFVVVEITEPIEPCANLCKLSYINDNSISPSDRIRRCQDFIQHLDRFDGYRGWYAKVIQGGTITCGAQVSELKKE